MTFAHALDEPLGLSEPDARSLLGGKAANLGVMARDLGLPVPPGFVITTETCRRYLAGGWPAGLDDELRERMRGVEAVARTALRRPGRPAARQRPLGRARVDARDDGHDPRPRPQRRDDRRTRPRHRRRGLRPRLPRPVRGELPLDRRRRRGPVRSVGPAAPGDRGGLPLVEERSRPGVPRGRRGSPTTSGRPSRSRRWSSATAARLGDRRAVHPRSGDGRGRAVRRRHVRRPGRGRRRRDPPDRADRGPRRAPPRGRRRAPGGRHASRAPLPGPVRHRVHDRVGPALAAPGPGRQAQPGGGAADRGRHGRGRSRSR